MTLLSVQGLSVSYGHASAVSEISFDLEAGGTIGLIGESGSGKSTVVNAILGMLGRTARPSGRISFQGDDILLLSREAVRKLRGSKISIVPQAALGALNPMLTVGRQLTELVRLYNGVGHRAAWNRSAELLDLVGLPDAHKRLGSYPHQFSGGQSQRILIAMALAGDPKLVLADEPTTALDVTVQRRILDLLQRLQRELGFSLIFVTHHLALLPGLAEQIVVMRKGRLVESGSANSVISAPREEYTRTLLSIAKKAEEHDLLAPEQSPFASQTPVLEVRNLSVKYSTAGMWGRRSQFALRQVNFRLMPGTCLGIVGESGSGKTTLCRALMGLADSEGEVYVDGTELGGLSKKARRNLRRGIHLVFQDSQGALNPAMKIRDILREPLKANGIEVRAQDLVRALEDVSLPSSFLDRRPSDLSGGERQRVAIARGLIFKPRLLILDEPLSSLDVATQSELIELLRRAQLEYRLTSIIVSHDLDVMRTLADQLLVLNRGALLEQGPTHQIFDAPKHEYTKALIDAVPRLYGSRARPLTGSPGLQQTSAAMVAPT